MKATGYLQIVPHRRRNGDVFKVSIGRLTQGTPAAPEPGALVVKVEVDVDPSIFVVPTVTLRLDGDPSEVAAAVVPVPVEAETGTVTDDAG